MKTKITALEIFGYIGSLLIALSYTTNDMFWLRFISSIGNLIFIIYGFKIKSYPVAFLNIFILLTNIFHILIMFN